MTEYGKIEVGKLTSPPNTLTTAAAILNAGYLPIVKAQMPTASAGKYYVAGYDESNGSLVQRWDEKTTAVTDASESIYDLAALNSIVKSQGEDIALLKASL
jgi:hypothetical protein